MGSIDIVPDESRFRKLTFYELQKLHKVYCSPLQQTLHTILNVFDRNSIQWEQMPTIERTFTKRRVGPRFSFLVDAEIVLGDGTSIPTQLDQVSLRGCYLDTLEPIPVGTRFLLKIGEGRKAFEVQGKIIYTHSGSGLGMFGQGVVFTELSAQERSAINLWLREVTSKRIAGSIREI